MTYSDPARTAARRTRSTVCGARRRRVLLVARPALLLAHAALAAARHPLTDKGGAYLSPVAWPQSGQAALVLGGAGRRRARTSSMAPIASLAKVLTAYLTLERYPLSDAQDGFTITVTEAQAQVEAQDQSAVPVAAGARLTERQLLEAQLIPSGNNIAQVLATQVAGSQARFIVEMNAEAGTLGMDHTVYIDPSGGDPGTVSTAAHQLRVFQRALRLPVLRQVVSMVGVTLPVAGTVTDFNPLIAECYAGQTGSDSANGGPPRSWSSPSPRRSSPSPRRSVCCTLAAPGAGGPGGDAGRHGPPLLPAPSRSRLRAEPVTAPTTHRRIT